MGRILILSFAIMLYSLGSVAQSNLQPPKELKASMDKLELLAGHWEGEGWVQMGPTKHKFKQQEDISYKANHTVLEIEGLGKDSLGNAVHQAFAVITFNADQSSYQMLAVRADGKVLYPEIIVSNTGELQWGFESSPNSHVKFTIQVKDETWHETGSFSSDGTHWIPFLEMNLKKSSMGG